jgi:hypothetical protein
MKIKTDFVTNSSSSSFVVMGIHVDMNKIDLTKMQKIKSKQTFTIEEFMEDPYEYLDPHLKGSDLTWSNGSCYDNEDLMVGICYTNMGEDETLRQFKQRVTDQVKDKLGYEATPVHIEECWMDN